MKGTLARLVVLGLVMTSTTGCFTTEASPLEYGIDVRAAPGFDVGDGGLSVHPTAAYARGIFGGVDGVTNSFIHLGGQLRLDPNPEEAGLWFGAEGTWTRRRTSFDGSPGAGTRNGWTAAALAGFPLTELSFGVINAYAAAGLIDTGSSGPYFRVGLDLQPAFLQR